MLAAACVVSEIVLPLVFAIVLKLLLQPALRTLERLHVPRILAALLLILALFGTIVCLVLPFQAPPVPGQPSFRRAFASAATNIMYEILNPALLRIDRTRL